VNYDCYTAKYAAADGARLWEKRYDGPANGNDRGTAIALDGSGNVVVTGHSRNGSPNFDFDYYTAKYRAADGVLLWEKRYNGPANQSDYASAVAVDGGGHVVVTGISFNDSRDGEARDGDIHTLKYAAEDGALLWEERYSPSVRHVDDLNDAPPRVAIRHDGSVVMAGSLFGDSAYDYVTVVYRETIELSASRVGSNQLILSWPANAVGFLLQSTPQLTPPVTWTDVTNAPVLNGTRWTVTNNLSGNAQFYRLRKP
jgi:outer membrane protein assembly factor BamB